MNISEFEFVGIIAIFVLLTVVIKNLEILTRRSRNRYLHYRDVREFTDRLDAIEKKLERLQSPV